MIRDHQTVTIVRIADPLEKGFQELYDIYSTSIVPSEQKTYAALAKMAQNNNYLFFTLQEQNRYIGFSIFYISHENDMALLEYVAIKKGYRDHSFGSLLLSHNFRFCADHYGITNVLVEIDSDCDQRAVDIDTRKQRIKFYNRLGCRRINGLQYAMPKVGNGQPPQMDLYLRTIQNRNNLTRPRLERWMQTIYRGIYHRPPNDPRISRILKSERNTFPLETQTAFST